MRMPLQLQVLHSNVWANAPDALDEKSRDITNPVLQYLSVEQSRVPNQWDRLLKWLKKKHSIKPNPHTACCFCALTVLCTTHRASDCRGQSYQSADDVNELPLSLHKWHELHLAARGVTDIEGNGKGALIGTGLQFVEALVLAYLVIFIKLLCLSPPAVAFSDLSAYPSLTDGRIVTGLAEALLKLPHLLSVRGLT